MAGSEEIKNAAGDEPVPMQPVKSNTGTASINDGKVADVAVDIVHAAEEEFTPEQYRKVLRKADFILLPLMWVSNQPPHFQNPTYPDLLGATDLLGNAICGQGRCLYSGHLWPPGRHPLGWTAVLL